VSVTVVTRGSTGTLGKKIMAKGGIIDEPVMGVGARTGREYLIGEAGPEAVVPLSGGKGAMPAPGGGVGRQVSQTFIAPNYIGPLDQLKRALVDLGRTGQLAGPLRAAGVAV
jgi:phage-related minor tail protein